MRNPLLSHFYTFDRLPADSCCILRLGSIPLRTRRFGTIGILLSSVCLSSGCASLSKNKIDENVVSARQLSLRGVDAMQHGRMTEAETLFSSALEVCPQDERIQCHYAETLWQVGERERAIAHMEQAVRLSGGNAELLVRLGDMYLAQGDLQRAARQAELATRAKRQLASAWALRGDVLSRTGHPDESLASYHRALSYQGHYPRVQLAIAETYRQQGRHARTLATLRSLADGYPGGEVPLDVLVHQGIALKELGRYEAAIETFAEAATEGETTPDRLYHLAEAQLLAGDPINARLTARTALAKTPQHGPSRDLVQRLESLQPRVAVPVGVDVWQR